MNSPAMSSQPLVERAGQDDDRVDARQLQVDRLAGFVGGGLELQAGRAAAGVAGRADARVGDQPLAVFVAGAIDQLHRRRPAGRVASAAAWASSAKSRVVPGCDVLALAMTGLPAAMAAAKSPPRGAVEGERKVVRPEDDDRADRRRSSERMLCLVSIVGMPTSLRARPRRPGEAGSSCAAARYRPAAATGQRGFRVGELRRARPCGPSIRAAKASRNAANLLAGAACRNLLGCCSAAASASSQSCQVLIGNSSQRLAGAGFSARKCRRRRRAASGRR